MAPRYSFGPTKDLKIDVGVLIIKNGGFFWWFMPGMKVAIIAEKSNKTCVSIFLQLSLLS